MEIFGVGIDQISNPELGQAWRLAGFHAEELAVFTLRNWLVFLLRGWLIFVQSWSGAESISLYLVSEPKCVFFFSLEVF